MLLLYIATLLHFEARAQGMYSCIWNRALWRAFSSWCWCARNSLSRHTKETIHCLHHRCHVWAQDHNHCIYDQQCSSLPWSAYIWFTKPLQYVCVVWASGRELEFACWNDDWISPDQHRSLQISTDHSKPTSISRFISLLNENTVLGDATSMFKNCQHPRYTPSWSVNIQLMPFYLKLVPYRSDILRCSTAMAIFHLCHTLAFCKNTSVTWR